MVKNDDEEEEAGGDEGACNDQKAPLPSDEESKDDRINRMFKDESDNTVICPTVYSKSY